MKAVLAVALIAVVIYLVIRLVERLNDRRHGVVRRPGDGGRSAPRVSGPDDDPDFLRDLDRRKKKRPDLDDS